MEFHEDVPIPFRGAMAVGPGMMLQGLLVVLCVVATACRPRSVAAPGVVAPATEVTLVSDEADAALAVLAAGERGDAVPAALWDGVWSSRGYRRLAQRERAMGRAFTDSAFRVFLLSDTLGVRRRALARTLAEWKRADVTDAGARAAAYLPPGTPLRATLFPLIKPQTNSFVFDLGTDSAAIFLYLDPDVTRAQLETTLAHELHHVGFAAACAAPADTTMPEAQRTAVAWLGAFGEGIAVLAAAGGPDAHPHAVSGSAERARWDRDYARVGADLPRIEAFLRDVLSGRLAEAGAIRERAMSFFGDAQGPWYTVGYAMAVTVERSLGREALIEVLCDRRRLLRRYNAAAAAQNARVPSGERLPLWSESVLRELERESEGTGR